MKPIVVAAFAVFASACGAAPPTVASDPEPGEAASASDPELAAKEREFMNACGNEMDGADAYCACGWQLLIDIAGVEALTSDRATRDHMEAFEAQIGDACADQLPADVIEKQFMAGCTAGAADREALCRCSWDALREKLEPGEIARVGKKPTPAVAEASDHAAKTCRDLAIEVEAKAGFMKGCAKAEILVPFCSCAWDIVRDSASAEDVITGKADVDALKPTIKASCGKHLPTE